MFARVLTFTGVTDFDAAINYLRETALPVVQSQRGYKGMTASADRSGGVLGILSLWESEADRDASDSALGKTRQEAQGQFATGLAVETFEERVVQMTRPPEVGSRLMVTHFSMDPAKVDENIEFFKNVVAPDIAANPGFRALRNMVDAQTGEGIVGAVWDDESSMQAAAASAATRRPDAATRGVNLGEPSYREIVFTDFR
jgi:heme-degrading monooxygenase HmoA